MKYGTKRHRPAGEWVNATMSEKVAGIHHRKGTVRSWTSLVRRAEQQGLLYGTEVVPEPGNSNDANAIKVIGFVQKRGMFGGLSIWRGQLGYLPAWLAAEINEDLLSQGLPIACELYSIYEGDDFYDVNVIVLAPPGHSHSARMKRRS